MTCSWSICLRHRSHPPRPASKLGPRGTSAASGLFNLQLPRPTLKTILDLHRPRQLNQQPQLRSSLLPAAMPLPRVAGLRSAGALRLSQRCTSPFVLRSQPSRCRQQIPLALSILPAGSQFRLGSTSPPNQDSESSSKQAGQSPKPSPALKGMLWQAIKTDASRALYVIRNTSFSEVMRNHPGEAFGAIVA
jgi:hypothetical protein